VRANENGFGVTLSNHRTRVLVAVVAIALTANLAAVHAQTGTAVPADVATLAGQHPAEYYRRAAKLFQDGEKDDAVFVFYLGQLRYRARLAARRDLKPDGDPALFLSLSEVVGRPLNEYAFGDIPALARILEAVLAYDQADPDRFTPPSQFRQAYAGVRDGLSAMKGQIVTDADSIRAKRRQNGLETRN
jgi:hypothetical protein